jgi:hypothetical protein
MKRLVAVLVVTLLVAACGDSAQDATTTTAESSGAGTVTTESQTSTTEAPQPTTAPPSDIEGTVNDLMGVTEDLRGLEFLESIPVAVLSAEDLSQRVREDIEEEMDPDEIVIDEAFFRLIGILPDDVDLAQAIEDLYAEQVAGFYDSDAGEIVVAGGQEVSPLTRSVIVHELIHALTDQHFGFGAVLDELYEQERYHEAAALLSLVEGDATYFELLYLQDLPVSEQMAAITEMMEYDTSVIDSLPDWLQSDLYFPYETGFGFVERLVQDQGIAGINQAYEQMPTTVEQVMHPEKYYVMEPGSQVQLAATPVDGYEIYEEGVFGEWSLRIYLLDGTSTGNAVVASSGWGGDAYRIMWNGTDVAFAYLFAGDSTRDAEELESALVESVDAAMAVGRGSVDGDEQSTTFVGTDYAYVQRSGEFVLFVAADDQAVGEYFVQVLALTVEEEAA